MPTYEYECKACLKHIDVFQNMSDPPLKVCPFCGKELRRVINGGSGVIFKGKGFYVTDNNKAPSRSTKNSPSDSSSSESSKSTGSNTGTAAGGSETAKASDKGKSATTATEKAAP